jgi:hypothetical protein
MVEMKKRGTAAQIVIAAVLTAAVVSSQTLVDQVNFKGSAMEGFRLYGVSAYTGYSTSALPLGLNETVPSGVEGLSGSGTYGASASFGWQHRRDRTNASLFYSGSYSGMTHYSNLNSLSHSLSLSASRQLTPKWTLTLTGSAQDGTLAEYLYQPTALSVLSQLPTTFDDLAAAFSIGQFSNSQIASMLTGASVLDSPARGLLLGDRVLSYAANVGLNYAPSSRLSIHFASFSAGGQNRRNGQDNIQQVVHVLPRSLGMNAGVSLAYALSPRTQVGLSVDENRVVNIYQDAYTTNGLASIGRKMGIRWFLSVRGGGSLTRTLKTNYGIPASRQVIGGGSIGFRTYTQTFVASYDRSSSDTYGFAVGTNTTATGSWNWRRPGSRWTLFTSGGQHRMGGTGYAHINGWEASGGLSARMSERTTVSGQYVYFNSSGNYLGNVTSIAVHSVRITFAWSPQPLTQP